MIIKKKFFFPPFNCYRGGRDRRGDLRETVQTGSITNVPEPGRPTALPINGEHSVQRESSWNQTTWSTSLEPSSEKDRSIGAEAGETGPPQDLSEENQGRAVHIVVTQERVEKFLWRWAGHREEESAQQHGTPEADRAAKRVRGSAYPRASCREEGEGAESRDLEASGCLLWYIERDEPDLDGPGGGSEAATREASNEAQCSEEESRHDALRERLGRIVSDSAHEHAKHTSTCSKRTSRICCYSLGEKKGRMDGRATNLYSTFRDHRDDFFQTRLHANEEDCLTCIIWLWHLYLPSVAQHGGKKRFELARWRRWVEASGILVLINEKRDERVAILWS